MGAVDIGNTPMLQSPLTNIGKPNCSDEECPNDDEASCHDPPAEEQVIAHPYGRKIALVAIARE